jgi:glycosyltransferase involved in cell wall biosynthesis
MEKRNSIKICIIGNNASGHNLTDGGRIKIRLYKQILESQKHEVSFVDLDGWKKRIPHLIYKLRKRIIECETILIMAGPKGCRVIIPLVNYLNRNCKKRTVFCPLGIGTLDYLIEKMPTEKVTKFLSCEDFFGIKDDKMAFNLSKLDVIIPQNEVLTKVYRSFYKINNCFTLPNFRDIDIQRRLYSYDINQHIFSITFISRIKEEKGIFLLLEAIKSLNAFHDDMTFKLDIYGENQLSIKENLLFASYFDDNIRYKGVLPHHSTIDVLSKYDLFCLPTKYHGEGTPGVLLESLISGTPPLISSYSQADYIIENGVNGFIFKMNDVNDLRDKIYFCAKNCEMMKTVSHNCQILAQQYTFEYNKELFSKYVVGIK